MSPVLMYIDNVEKLTRFESFRVDRSYSTTDKGTIERFDVVGKVRGVERHEVVIELPTEGVAEVFADLARAYIAR